MTNLNTIKRMAEMSAEILRDPERTGSWEGAEKVARQFDRIARLAESPDEPVTETPIDLRVAVLEGEIELHHDELKWWAEELDFWRCKYLRDHPEHDNWAYVRNARKDEETRGY